MADSAGHLDGYLRALIHEVIQEVLAECGYSITPKLYDVPTVATMLSVPERWLYEHTAKDSIPHHHIGKYIRFSDADLREIIGKAGAQ